MGRNLSNPEPLVMTNIQYDVIHKIATRPTTTIKMSTRAHILLSGYEGKPYSVISKELGVHVQTVKSWQNRWISASESFANLTTKTDF